MPPTTIDRMQLMAVRVARAVAATVEYVCPCCWPQRDADSSQMHALRSPLVEAEPLSSRLTTSDQSEVRLINAVLQSILPLIRLQISRQLIMASDAGGIPIGQPDQPPLFRCFLRPPAGASSTSLQPEDVIETLRLHVLTARIRNMVARSVSVRRWVAPDRAQPRHRLAIVRLQRAFRRSFGGRTVTQPPPPMPGVLRHAPSVSTNQKLCVDLQARIFLEVACDNDDAAVPNLEIGLERAEGLPTCLPEGISSAQAVLRHLHLEAGLRVWWDMLNLTLDVAFTSTPTVDWDLDLAVGGVTVPNWIEANVFQRVVSLVLRGFGPRNPLRIELQSDEMRESLGVQHLLHSDRDDAQAARVGAPQAERPLASRSPRSASSQSAAQSGAAS